MFFAQPGDGGGERSHLWPMLRYDKFAINHLTSSHTVYSKVLQVTQMCHPTKMMRSSCCWKHSSRFSEICTWERWGWDWSVDFRSRANHLICFEFKFQASDRHNMMHATSFYAVFLQIFVLVVGTVGVVGMTHARARVCLANVPASSNTQSAQVVKVLPSKMPTNLLFYVQFYLQWILLGKIV